MENFPLLHLRESSTTKVPQSVSNEYTNERAKNVMDWIETEYDLAAFNLSSFGKWIAEKRQCQLHFIGWRMPMNLYGAWIAADCHDFIFFDKHTPRLHQSHIQMHELSHILLEHQTLDVSKETGTTYHELMEHFAILFRRNQGQAQSAIYSVIRRSLEDRNTQDELEAEALSVMIRQRVLELQVRNEWQTPLSFSHNPFILETYQSLDWV